jgi:lipoprotein-anchoring transpeptidase ErfK/SrfK
MARGQHVRTTRLRTFLIGVGVVLGVLLLGGAAFAYAGIRYERTHADRILPGVSVADVDVGGMTRAEAKQAVKEEAVGVLRSDITISVEGQHWITNPAQLGRRALISQAVAQAMSAGDGMGTLDRAWHRLRNDPVDVEVPLTYRTVGDSIDALVGKIAKSAYRPPRNASIGITQDANDVVFIRAKPGAKVDQSVASEAIHEAVDAGRSSVRLTSRPVDPKVTAANLGANIVVRVDQNRLYLYDGFSVVRTWPVATAKPGYETPTGVWNIWDMRKDPTWYNPALDGWGADLPAVVPGGPTAPMGTRAIYIDAPGLIRVHGTPDDASIGRYASHGCIRMHNSDVEALFELVDVGQHVVIVGHRPAGASYWDTPGNADI